MLQTSILLLLILPFVLYRSAEFLNLNLNRQHSVDPKTLQYHTDRVRLLWLKESTELLLTLSWIYLGGLNLTSQFSYAVVQHFFPFYESLYAFLFVGIHSLLFWILQLPFSVISTFIIEERYGFNTTTLRIFCLDQLKIGFISLVLGTLIYSLWVTVIHQSPSPLWFYCALALVLFQFGLVWIAPVILLPLFMKLNELKEGPLFDQLRHYQDHLHFKLNGIWVSDASQRSKKSNAFFTGFGRSRRLVLFDTLLQNHTDSEIVAVVAHEVGHYRLGHIWKGLFLSTMGIFVFLWLTESLVQTGLSFSALQLSHVVELPTSLTLPLNWILSFYLLHKATFFVTLITQAFSRKYEYQADAFAYQTTQDSQAMQRALLKLEKDNRSLPYSHPLYTALYASHPPVSERVKALDLLNQYPIEPILP